MLHVKFYTTLLTKNSPLLFSFSFFSFSSSSSSYILVAVYCLCCVLLCFILKSVCWITRIVNTQRHHIIHRNRIKSQCQTLAWVIIRELIRVENFISRCSNFEKIFIIAAAVVAVAAAAWHGAVVMDVPRIKSGRNPIALNTIQRCVAVSGGGIVRRN